MRKIEKQMLHAISTRKSWQGGNTTVSIRDDNSVSVFLHGNHIADVWSLGFISVNKYTLSKWATNTTKSRLRALGANVCTRKGVTYLNNEPV
jgi:hypothetical protein